MGASGFGRRLAAAVIDVIAFQILIFLVGMAIGYFLLREPLSAEAAQSIGLMLQLGNWILLALYLAVLESSPWRATIGKRLMGLVVTERSR